MKLLAELHGRNVIRMTGLYLAAAGRAVQMAATLRVVMSLALGYFTFDLKAAGRTSSFCFSS